jgi:hypothetical protein
VGRPCLWRRQTSIGEGGLRLALALASEKAMQAIGARDITRVVVRPPRLVNIVTAVKAVEAPV